MPSWAPKQNQDEPDKLHTSVVRVISKGVFQYLIGFCGFKVVSGQPHVNVWWKQTQMSQHVQVFWFENAPFATCQKNTTENCERNRW